MENNIIRLEDAVQEDSGASDYYSLRAWDEMIEEYDASWFTQGHSSLMGLVSCGRMRLNGYLDQINQRMNGALGMIREQIKVLAACAAASALGNKKEFDMKVSYPAIGAAGKNYAVFNGWRLAHFEKLYKFNNVSSGYYEKTNWDFVLGEDGEIYHVTSWYAAYDNPSRAINDDWKFSYEVRKAIFFDTCILNNRNQAYFIAVSHGAFLTVNQILEHPGMDSGNFVLQTKDGNEENILNFPLQPNGRVEVGVQRIHDLLWSFLPPDMTEEGLQEMEQRLKAEEQARLAKLEAEKEAERQAAEQKRQEHAQKERERLEAQRQAEDAEARRREQEAREQSIMKAKQRIKELEQERKDASTELANIHGIFSGRKRQQLQGKLDSIDKEIKCLQDL